MASRKFAKGIRRTALAAAFSMCFAGALMAQETGGLRITITSSGGAPVAGATVHVSSPDSLVAKTGVTNADGSINVRGLDPATNYTVVVDADGYQEFTANGVAVVSGKNLSVGYSLGATELDTVVVTGVSLAAVDTTSATVGTTLTLDMVEALPTGRSYQSYLQLVPGVKPSSSGNPASKSGVNFANIGGVTGTSTDNVYFLDGVNVTDPDSGTFGANFNSEIIQEQQVLTGGIPAKYAGGTGLVSRVVTKSGGNDFHGSVNYYLQNDSLVADDKHGQSQGFSTYDTAFTLGGPLIRDKLWFFASYQKKSRTDDVVNPNTGELLRSVDTESEYGFFKTTWQITDRDRLQATFFNDPYERSGSTNPSTLQNRDVARKQGGDNFKLSYSHDWDNFSLEFYGYEHKAQLKNTPANLETRNDVAYMTGDPTNADLQLGGSGSAVDLWKNRKEYGIKGEYWLDTSFGTHNFEFGFSMTDSVYKENSSFTGPEHAQYNSIGLRDAGVTFEDYSGGAGWTGQRGLNSVDVDRILDAIANSADNAYYLGVLDLNGDGVVSADELLAYQFISTAGNPNGQVNAYRIIRAANNPYSVDSEGKTFYLQDSWTINQWTINAGLRAEEWTHFSSQGDELVTFGWDIAPRLSVVYDLFGDGTAKIWGFAGRYYDPIRNNMTDFAGGLTGPVDNEQIFIGDRWLTYRTRGGLQTPDAVFAPSIETPYTDEFMLGYETTLTQNLGFKVTATYRETKNVLEDYDLALYSNPDQEPGTGNAPPGSMFFLPYSYFGFDGKPNANYVIGTLAGGKREYKGLTATLRKYRADNWMGYLSYTYNDFKGNTNSDSNADFQGDWIALDPRAPNRWGPMPGNIEHQFKAVGAYFFDFGLEVSGVFNWNSGYVYNKSFELYGRHLPVMGDPYEYEGVYDSWLAEGATGFEAPGYYTFDVRAKYTQELGFGQLELFLDIFNILDKQSTIQVMDLDGGNGVYDFGEGTSWVAPRRFYVGARYSF